MKRRDMIELGGVYVNPVEHWYEWHPNLITNNVYVVISNLSRQLDIRNVDGPSPHPTDNGWFIQRFVDRRSKC